ncbi:MAG: peptidase and DD-carboxypeptidase VanY/endolysin [Herbinix sp.]|nr:peptidase and DD-carboxypeptidase VanY/endolysin [Herbinix sp.]
MSSKEKRKQFLVHKNRIILYTILSLVLFGAAFSWLLYQVRPDIVFGFRDYFTPRDEIILEEYEIKQLTLIQASTYIVTRQEEVSYNNNLLLVNNNYKVADDITLQLVEIGETGLLLDKEVVEPLNHLLATAEEVTGQHIYLSSAYRTGERQAELYEDDPKIAAEPGMSEHQIGLAADLIVKNFGQRRFVKTEAGKWVNQNCWKYGFIIRYPFLRKDVTGFAYEPWHIRYVGLPHSEIIYHNRLTLEEYNSMLETGHFYQYHNYVFGAVSGPDIQVPQDLRKVTVSSDNTGRYIITGIVLGQE